jgi:hypothetical protein
MIHSAALRETTRINLHCTGSKGGYESAAFIQLSGKILITNQKVDLTLKKLSLNISKTLIRQKFQ